jgi:hypothetical protein
MNDAVVRRVIEGWNGALEERLLGTKDAGEIVAIVTKLCGTSFRRRRTGPCRPSSSTTGVSSSRTPRSSISRSRYAKPGDDVRRLP